MILPPVAIVLFMKDGKILLDKDDSKPKTYTFNDPSNPKIDLSEKLLDLNIGIEPESLAHMGIIEKHTEGANGESDMVSVSVYLAETFTMKTQPTNTGWYALEQIPYLTMPSEYRILPYIFKTTAFRTRVAMRIFHDSHGRVQKIEEF